ncbi:ABC transporter permease [Clostridium sp.]|uniref:ABC transporter permease n=1 Tax=Clostridium sp. TaxID=1506 RepID=UPI0025BD1F79|nr:ABC transporter permease [Clostridium sp.]
MINLIRNENMKLSHSISTWIMMGILILIIVAVGLISRFTGTQASTTDWKAEVTTQNESLKKSLNQPGSVTIVEDSTKKLIKTNEYRLENNIEPVKANSLWGFVETSSAIISLISLFAIILGGKIVANEFSEGTIKLLLIRPSKRWKILLSKYITIMGQTILMLLVLFIVSFVLGGILFSFKGAATPYIANSGGKITEINMVAHIVQIYGLQCVNLVMMVTLAFMISSVFRNSAMAIGIGVFLLTIVQPIIFFLSLKFDWVKFILFANTDLNQYINGEPLIEGMTMTFSIIVLVVYFIIFNTISYLGFTKRDIVA